MCDGWYPLQPTIFSFFISLFFSSYSSLFFHKIHYFYIVSSRSAVRVFLFLFFSILIRLVRLSACSRWSNFIEVILFYVLMLFVFRGCACVVARSNRVVVPAHHLNDGRRTQCTHRSIGNTEKKTWNKINKRVCNPCECRSRPVWRWPTTSAHTHVRTDECPDPHSHMHRLN